MTDKTDKDKGVTDMTKDDMMTNKGGPFVVKLDPNNWYRGQGGARSRLVRLDGMMCCVGFACVQLGVDKKDLINKRLVGVDGAPLPKQLKFLFDDRYVRQSRIGTNVYDANDSTLWCQLDSDQDRIDELNRLCEPHNIRFELQ